MIQTTLTSLAFKARSLRRLYKPVLSLIPLSVLLVIGTSACSPLVRTEQPAHPKRVAVSAGNSVGQTFVARYNGLNGIALYLEPGSSQDGIVNLYLSGSPNSPNKFVTSKLPLHKIDKPGFYSLSFPPISNSARQDYFIEVEIDGQGDFYAGKAPGEAYLNGALYRDTIPENSQITFKLIYDPALAVTGLLVEVFNWLLILVIAVFLFILPGFATAPIFLKEWGNLLPGEKLVIAIAISLALYPLIYLLASLFRLGLGRIISWLVPLISILVITVRNRTTLRHPRTLITNMWVNIHKEHQFLEYSLILLILALIVLTRFWPIRNLDVPMWGDSYQHSLIAQLLAEHRGLFQSWEPYADLLSFTYHFGFHSLVTTFHWVSGMTIPLSALWTGQILNILAVICVYPLAMRVGGNRWAGIAALSIAGLLAPMPMYYLNWGRYTQLAGQVILPGAVLLAWIDLESEDRSWPPLLIVGLVFAGLGLTHYRILIFAGIFLIAFILVHATRKKWKFLIRRIVAYSVIAMALFLPWFIRISNGRILLMLEKQLTTPASQISTFTEQYNSIGNLATYLPVWLWVLLPLAITWGMRRRSRGCILISLWWLLIFLTANPQRLGLPGTGAISNFAVLISFYIPASILIGGAFGWLMSLVTLRKKGDSILDPGVSLSASSSKSIRLNQILIVIISILLITAGLLGARSRVGAINPRQFALVTRPDKNAFEWIKRNIAWDANFLVNSFFAYGDTLVVGSDGGWWLPLLSSRYSTLPPINYGSERGPIPDYRLWVNELTAEIEAKGMQHPDVIKLLRDRNVTHVYLGQRQGSVNSQKPLFVPEDLLDSPNYSPVYHQDRVWIFKVNYPNIQ